MISVCIATFNGEKYIKEQLESILIQISSDDEVIISDDSSTDKTIEIINEIGDPRIKILENNDFKSPIFNLENSLKIARGDYIFLSDQDDIWVPDKVAVCLGYLLNYDLVVSDCSIINFRGDIIQESFFKIAKSHKGFLKNFVKNSYLGCCIAFNRKILEYVLPFPEKIAMHDSWIGLNAEIVGKIKFIPNKLIYYRRHNYNASITSEVSKNSYWYRLQYRLYILVKIIQRFFRRK